MINSEPLHNDVSAGGTVTPTFNKQRHGFARKTALRDVQNQKSSLKNNHQDSSLFLGAMPTADPTRACGIKRLTPELPSNSSSHRSLSSNGTNEHILNARRRIDLELGRGRTQSNMEKFAAEGPHPKQLFQSQGEIPQKQNQLREGNNSHLPVAMPNNSTPMITYSHCGPSVPKSLGKITNGIHVSQTDSAKFSSERMHSLDVKVDYQQMTERFSRLQKFLKQCDESNQRDYIQMLLHLSPAELSRHAVGLEKRAIQLTVDEGKEMQRVKAQNILGNPQHLSTHQSLLY